MTPHRFVLDFDGVVVDSVDEAALTAYNSLTEQLHTGFEALPTGYLPLFKRERSIVGPAAEFLAFARWCVTQCANKQAETASLSRPELKKLVSMEPRSHRQRTDHFFEMRMQLMAAASERWATFHRAYDPLASVLRARQPGDFLILTYKNVEAVIRLCSFFQIPANREHIFSGDSGVSKIENLNLLKQRYPAAAYTFIDDNVQNLLELQPHADKLTLLHAAWGYCTTEDREVALRTGIPSLECHEFAAML